MLRHLAVVAELTKFKLSLAVAFSSVTGYFLFRNDFDTPLLLVATGVFLLSSGAAALNQYTERKTDSLMERTGKRPLPSQRITEKRAILISVLLINSGSIILLLNGLLPFFLGILNVLLYNLLYTRLKRKTILAIIPGALVGAIPPMIGFVSAGGKLGHPYIMAFSGFMFLWQLPHFWLLIIKYGKEYNAAGFATISDLLTEREIRMLVFLWVLFSTSLLLLFFSITDSPASAIILPATLLNVLFIILFYRQLFSKKKEGEIRGAFIVINLFSLAIMILIIGASIFNII
jgi:protoheme IX farnesyltransferase